MRAGVCDVPTSRLRKVMDEDLSVGERTYRLVVLVPDEVAELKIRTPDGRVVTGRKLNFRVVREEWNEYELEDGTKLYVKLVLADVVRRNELNPFGEPVYQISSQNVVRVEVSKRALEEVEREVKKKEAPEVR